MITDYDEATPTVLRLYRELLGLDRVDPDTDFFDAGGNSLLAARLVAELRRDGWPVMLDDALTGRTPRAVAAAALRALDNDQAVGSASTRAASEAAREILDHFEGEVLHRCQTVLAPARVTLLRPLSRTVERDRRLALGRSLSSLLGIEFPEETLDGSPARIAGYARAHAAPPTMPITLAPRPDPDRGAAATLLLAPSPANIVDLRRAVAGRRLDSPAYGLLPLVTADDPQCAGASCDPLVDAALAGIGSTVGPGPYRLVGYCTSAWTAAALADRLVRAGAEVTSLVAINPPTLDQLHRQDFQHFIAAGNFNLDYYGLPEPVAVELHRAHEEWRSGRIGLVAAADRAMAAVTTVLPTLLANVADADAYTPAERELFGAHLRASLIHQFSVGRSAAPTGVSTEVLITNDATYLDPTTPVDVSPTATVHYFDCPQRLLLRQPEAARLVLGRYDEAPDAVEGHR